MKIKYLGTAAAEGYPGLFCRCGACEKARKLGGKNIRTRSQAVIDDTLLVDFPPDTLDHVYRYGVDLPSIRHLLVTHSHQDHFYPLDLLHRCEPFAHGIEGKLRIYGNGAVERAYRQMIETTPHRCDVASGSEFVRVELYSPFQAGDYRVTALRAKHYPKETCYVYLIEGEKTVLYANDTGLFEQEVWDYLKGRHIDLVGMDCTMIALDMNDYHMGLSGTFQMADRLRALGCTDTGTKHVVTHFSHNGQLSHQEIEERVRERGFQVAFDGFEIEC